MGGLWPHRSLQKERGKTGRMRGRDERRERDDDDEEEE
jgi:hypothetical protein